MVTDLMDQNMGDERAERLLVLGPVIEERTTMQVKRIVHKWAGLRTFAPDRKPVAGFAPDADGFFWLAGQGGFGLQTSPTMAAVTASLICGTPWPLADVTPEELSPLRF